MSGDSSYYAVHVHAFRHYTGDLEVIVSVTDHCGQRSAHEWRGHDELTNERWGQIIAKVTDSVVELRARVQQPF